MADKMNSYAILASLSPQEILDFQIRNGMLNLDDVREQIVDTERKKILLIIPRFQSMLCSAFGAAKPLIKAV